MEGAPVSADCLANELQKLGQFMEKQLITNLQPVLSKLDHIEGSIKGLKEQVEYIQEEQVQLRDQQDHLFERVTSLDTQSRMLQDKLEDMENRDRRNNLVFHDFVEQGGSQQETWEECEAKVKAHVESLGLKLPEHAIERAHRIKTKQTPRPIIVKFSNYKFREAVMAAFKEAKNHTEQEHRISADFAPATRIARSKLWPLMKEAFDRGEKPSMPVGTLRIGRDIYVYDHEQRRVIKNPERENQNHSSRVMDAGAGAPRGKRTVSERSPETRPPSPGPEERLTGANSFPLLTNVAQLSINRSRGTPRGGSRGNRGRGRH